MDISQCKIYFFFLFSLKSQAKSKPTSSKISVSVNQGKCYSFFGTIKLHKSYLYHPFILPSFHLTFPIISPYLALPFVIRDLYTHCQCYCQTFLTRSLECMFLISKLPFLFYYTALH